MRRKFSKSFGESGMHERAVYRCLKTVVNELKIVIELHEDCHEFHEFLLLLVMGNEECVLFGHFMSFA